MNKHIIIIHEVYGVTGNLKALREYLVKLGYSVSLPSLYEDNYTGSDEQESYERFYSCVGIEKSCRIVDEIVRENTDSEIILLGFSVGATIAWLSSTNERIDKIIGLYGSRIRHYLEIEPVNRAYLFFCRERTFDVEDLQTVLQSRKNVLSAIIPGEHGFYGKLDFNDSKIKALNEKILKIIELS